jgi:hypothetical protein
VTTFVQHRDAVIKLGSVSRNSWETALWFSFTLPATASRAVMIRCGIFWPSTSSAARWYASIHGLSMLGDMIVLVEQTGKGSSVRYCSSVERRPISKVCAFDQKEVDDQAKIMTL